MFRILELIGLFAPIAGGVLLVVYRKRSRAAFAWGIAGCALGVVGSVTGWIGERASVASALSSDETTTGILERGEMWSTVRLGLLIATAVLLVVAALVDRRHHRPVAWIAGGVGLIVLSVIVHGAEVDLGGDRERLSRIVGVLVEMVGSGMLGLGILVLCLAVVVHRTGHDGRTEPAELAKRVGVVAWRLYSDSRRSRRR